MSELVSLGTAVQFLTRLPVGRFSSGEPSALSTSTRYFPLAGFIVGVILAVSLWILHVVLPLSIAIAFMLAMAILLTGGLHEDGLADVADSAGAFGLEKKLEIMRDSRIGVYGSLALVLLILIKFLALWELSRISVEYCLMSIVAAHVLSRWSSVWLMARVDYARPSAVNKVIADGVTLRHLAESSLCVAIVFIPLALYAAPAVFLLLPIVWLLAFLCGHWFRKMYGGITGDCLGAANQLVEVAVYVIVLAMCWHGTMTR